MKVKCTVCQKVFDLQKGGLVLRAARAGATNLEEFLKSYTCRKCTLVLRHQSNKLKLNQVKGGLTSMEKLPIIKDSVEDEEEVSLDELSDSLVTVGINSDEEEEDDIFTPEEKQELNNLINEEDDEEEVHREGDL